jgi:GNAT superfamily N-acetyltransferase
MNVVGIVELISYSDLKEPYIAYFEVNESCRRRGYGREMFKWVEGYAWQIGM